MLRLKYFNLALVPFFMTINILAFVNELDLILIRFYAFYEESLLFNRNHCDKKIFMRSYHVIKEYEFSDYVKTQLIVFAHSRFLYQLNILVK